MKRIVSCLFAIVLALSSAGCVGAAQSATTSGVASSATLSLQGILDQRTARPGTGIVLGLIDRGKQTVYVSGQSGNDRTLDDLTLFEIGSDSKTLTATILASMALDGEVRLDDPIARLLPKGILAPSKDGQSITLLNLAEQRSGLPRLPSNMDATSENPYADYSTPDMYSFLNQYQLTRDPGASYEYSNYGIGLLGQLLANRAGSPYPALLQSRLLQPLGMSSTVASPTADGSAEFAAGHDINGNAASAWDFQSINPAGGLRSNMTDMLKFLRCNMGQGPLAKACLFAQQARADGEPDHKIGLVWNTNLDTGVVSHGGDTAGYHAFIAISKDHQRGVVVLSNGPMVADIAAHALYPSYPAATCPTAVASNQTDLSEYAGVYCVAGTSMTFRVNASKSADELMISLDPQPAYSYEKIAPETYRFAQAGATITFVRQGGNIVGLELQQHAQNYLALRLDGGGKPVVPGYRQFPSEVTLDRSDLQAYVGKYNAGPTTFTVTLNGDMLNVQITGQPAVPVYASAKDEFFYKIVDAQITFGRDRAGNVSMLMLHQNGGDMPARRASPM